MTSTLASFLCTYLFVISRPRSFDFNRYRSFVTDIRRTCIRKPQLTCRFFCKVRYGHLLLSADVFLFIQTEQEDNEKIKKYLAFLVSNFYCDFENLWIYLFFEEIINFNFVKINFYAHVLYHYFIIIIYYYFNKQYYLIFKKLICWMCNFCDNLSYN